MSVSSFKTLGISPKAVAAFVWPVAAAALAATASWIITGDFNVTEIRTAASGVVLGLVGLGGAYLAEPGDVVPKD